MSSYFCGVRIDRNTYIQAIGADKALNDKLSIDDLIDNHLICPTYQPCLTNFEKKERNDEGLTLIETSNFELVIGYDIGEATIHTIDVAKYGEMVQYGLKNLIEKYPHMKPVVGEEIKKENIFIFLV